MKAKRPRFARDTRGLPAKILAVLIVMSAWQSVQASDIHWNPAAASRYSRKNGGTVLVICRKGMPDAAFYEPGYQPRTPSPVFSITKSVTALACLSLGDHPLGEIVRAGPGSEHVTLRHLLSQTSGISPGYEKLYKKNIADVRKAAASLPQDTAPGARFAYGPSHYESVGNVLKPAAGSTDGGRRALTGFLGRLGIQPMDWRTDRQGHIYLSAGLVLTPEDLLKIGRFVRDRGNGFRPLIPAAKFETAFTGSPANPAYGLGFWLNKAAGNSTPRDIEDAIGAHLSREEWRRTSLSNLAPRDMVSMVGSGGQRVYIIPSLGAVIVRLGHPSKFKDPDFLRALFSSKEH